jgi:LysR family glycine cleavage system transcriptional activator
MSFTRAAAELCVTQTAVSHQIKQLEAHLGVALFLREPRRLTLTPDGQAWAREMRDIFGRLLEANRRLRARARVARPSVAVSVIPSFAARWLVPRLGRFLMRYPDVDVHISPDARLVDFAVEPIDIGIRYGGGRYPGLVVEKLADDVYIAVCAPSVRAQKKLVSPQDLCHHALLHDDEPDAWMRWLALNGVHGLDVARGSVLTDSSMLVAAAVEGQGVALARRSLAMDDIAGGRLVEAFPRAPPMPTGRAYYMASPRECLARPCVAAFRDWLRSEASCLPAAPPTAPGQSFRGRGPETQTWGGGAPKHKPGAKPQASKKTRD